LREVAVIGPGMGLIESGNKGRLVCLVTGIGIAV
jgi:hypothetical protein